MTDQQPHTSNQHADHTSHIEDTENYENSISPKSQCEGAKDEEDDGLEFSGFNDVAFYCMPQSNKLRRACLHIITSPWFEKTVILVILLNCLTLGMYQPCLDAKGCTTTRCRVLSVFDNVIYAFFLLEMVVKVIAMGFVGKKAYLDEAWNRLDLFIIIAGTGELISSAAAEYGLANGEINLSAIRTIRVLRPLRAINRIPNLRILVMLLLDTLPMLGNVLLMCFFVFFIFGILGVQLWAGKLRQRCFMSKEMNKLISNITTEYNISKPTSDYYEGLWSSLDFICSTGEDAGMLKCTDIEPLVVNDTPCTLNLTEATYGYLSPNFTSPDNYSCINWNQYYTDCKPEGPNPFQEAISFDNIASAWIAIFQVISLEGWVDIMYYLQDTHSYWVWIYFLALIVIGAFFMVNLFLVVIATQFSETKRRETDKINEERKRYKSSTTLTSNRTESDGCYNQLLTYFIHVVKHTKRKLTRKYYAWWQRNHKDHDGDTSEADIKLNLFGNHIHCHPCEHMMALVETCNAPIASPEPSDIDSMSYYSNIQRIFGQSPASRRSSRVEPLIRIYPEPTVGETSFTAPISSNHRSLQNGSLQVIVDANDCPENMALLRVVQSHKPLAGTYSLGSRPNSNHSSPQPSPILARRDKGSPAPLSPTPAASSNGHLPLRRSRSNGDRPMMTNNNDSLTIPNVTRFPPLRSLSNHLQVPNNDMNGSIHSLLSHQSSISNTSSKNNQVTLLTPYDMCHKSVSRRSSYMSSNGKSVIVPNLPADGGKRFSFSMLSYMNGGCDMNCSKCQHLCVEVKRREASKVRKEEKEKGCCSKLIAFWDNDKVTKARATMKKWVDGAIFRFFILGAILVNTVTMGIEHHNQPPLMTLVVEVFNYIFIAVFTIEMVVKLIADGFYAYIKDTLCVFDGFIVIMSFVELASGEENSGLSVLRTFRLLRILKLIRFMPALQKQFLVMVRTMDNVASFFGLLMLFMFIFSVLGMNLFGCLLKSRRNFNSLLWSLITVFQILTQEDWNIIMYDGMSTTSPWAALYFVALMTIGNYVLFNLLVAILVEGFSSVTQDRLVTKILKQLKRDRQLLDEPCTNCGNSYMYNCPCQKLEVDLERLPGVRGESSSVPAEELEAAVLKHEIDMVQQVESGGGAVLPSIITDHPEASNQNLDTNLGPNQNLDTNLGLTPIITRTEATPRGSPKSEIEVPIFTSRFPSIDEPQVVLDTSSISSWNPFANASPRPVRHSRSRSIKSTSTSPRFSRKGSRNSRHSSRHDISEDKVMLMDEDDQSQDDVFSFADSQCRINSIKNFDLLQVPAVTDFHHSSDQISVKSDNVTTKQNGSLSPLTILIPDNHSSCNGSVHHNSLGLKHLGEQTPLLTALCEDAAGGDGKALRERWRKTHLLRNNVISSVDTDDSHKSPAKSPANIIPTTFSNPVQENGVSRDYPYSDTEKGDAQDTREEKESKTIYQRVVHFCRPRGCFLQRADYSLYLFSPTNRFRRFCTSISTKKWFDYSVLVLIGLNCIALAVERPSIPPESLERKILMYANYSFTFLFLLEMIIKVTAQGFVIGPTTYLKNGWNINDGFLVVVSMIDCFITWSFATSPKIFGVLRVLRLLRALRPLRVISRAPGLKLVVETLLSSLRPIGNIVLICLTFYLIFGILGVQLFKGTFYHCVGENLTNITNKDQCHEHGYKWENEKYNFDHLGSALMSLFVLSSKDGWVMIMYTGLDAVGIDQQPQENYSEWRLLYFISFLLLVGFFVLNMFVGVVVENFHRCREVHEKEEREKREQRRQKKLAKKMANKKKALGILVDAENEETAPNISNPTEFNETDIDDERNEPPYWTSYGPRRLVFHNLVTNKYFDIAVSIIIFLNVISMAVEHYQMSNEMVFALKVLNYVFTFIFILEAIFKMVALGFVRYIKERWNQLDVLIVLLSLLGIAMEEIETGVMPINPTIIRVMRMLRIARVLKLLKMAKGIRALLDTVLVALPQVGNLGLLFFLLFFIFAALGVELFGRIECSEEHPCEGMGVHANFEDSGAAFLTLFRIATGDNWNGIMKDALREDCDSSENCSKNCCVNTIITPIYFVIFVLTAQFVLVNVVVAVLMKHLEDANFSADKILYSRRLALTNEDGQDLTNQQVTTSTQSRLNYSHPSTLDDRENIQVHQDSERESCLLSGDELDASTKELDNNHIDAATDKELEKDQNEVNDTESDDALHLKPLHRQRSLPPNFRLSLEMIT